MAGEEFEQAFALVQSFGWDSKKRERIFRERGIDFDDVRTIFNDYTYVRRSDRYDEVRYQIFGYFKGEPVTVVCALRGPLCHIISARRASRPERRKFYDSVPLRTEPRQD